MARTITISVIIALILGLSIFSIIFTENTKNKMQELTAEAIEACEKRDSARLGEKTKALSDLFEERQGFLSFYVRHDEIEKLENFLVSLRGYTKTDSFDTVNAILHQIEFQAGHIYERELLTVDQLL